MKKASCKYGLGGINACLSIVLLFVLSACSFWPGSYEEIAWQEEVLWAQECGLEDMVCCLDKEPECDEGFSCCVSPIDKEENMCRDECTCGLADNYCCAQGDLCREGSVCQDNVCRMCGEISQPCCSGSICSGDLTCYQEQCVLCGELGNPCCESEQKCNGQNDKGDEQRTECIRAICQLCGGQGRIACPSEPKCNANNLFNNGACLNCGNANEPCCEREIASSTESYCQENNLSCQAGFCIIN